LSDKPGGKNYLYKNSLMSKEGSETKWFFAAVIFVLFYCGFLFAFKIKLIAVETKWSVSIIKPENGQIIAIGLLTVLFHFAFCGLYFFSTAGRWQQVAAILSGVLITGGILYGFKLWYNAITNNPFFQPDGRLPWYAGESNKFLLAHSPFILFLVFVCAIRTTMMVRNRINSQIDR
jgi:hypothetical protein